MSEFKCPIKCNAFCDEELCPSYKAYQQGKSERRYLIKEDGSIHNLDEDIERAYRQGRADVIAEVLALPRHVDYDMWEEPLGEAIYVRDIEKLKEQK